jgi:hypothetical protein
MSRKTLSFLLILVFITAGLFLMPDKGFSETEKYSDKNTATSFVVPLGWEVYAPTLQEGLPVLPGLISLLKRNDEMTISRNNDPQGDTFRELTELIEKRGIKYQKDTYTANNLAYNHIFYSYKSDGEDFYYEGYFLKRGDTQYVIALHSEPNTALENKKILKKLVTTIRYK